MSAPHSARRRAARVGSGQALFDALATTIRLLRWLLIGLAGVYLTSGITRVAPHEDALIYRLGRLQRELHSPGLLFALPAPFDRVVRVATRTQHELFLSAWSPDEEAMSISDAAAAASAPAAPTHSATAAVLAGANFPGANNQATAPAGRGLHPVFAGYTVTGDTNIVQTRFTVRYRIVDPRAFVSATQGEAATPLIEAACYDAATRTLATTTIDDALGAGLEKWRQAVLVLAQKRIDACGLGLALVAFEVNLITPPQAAVAAFAEVTSAQVEARTTLEQARTHRAQTLPRATSDAYRIRQQADAEARELVARASGEAASFVALLDEYRRAPDLVVTRLRAETLDQVLPRVKTKTLLPAGDGQLNLFLRDNP